MRDKVGSIHKGTLNPAKLNANPPVVAKIRGFRMSSRQKPVSLWRAIGQTAAMLNMGTQKPISSDMSNRPSAPASLSDKAKAMKELNLNAT
jgi:hypothetical protein